MKSYSERLSIANGIFQEGLRKVSNTPVPKGQKYMPGTFVMIANDLGQSMRHFEKNLPARVEYTYAHAYWGDDVKSYSLLVRYPDGNWSSIAWYYESQLSPIDDDAIIKEFQAEIAKQTEGEKS